MRSSRMALVACAVLGLVPALLAHTATPAAATVAPPTTGGTLHAITPQRLLYGLRIAPYQTVGVPVAGHAGLPAELGSALLSRGTAACGARRS
jgi:hypothetical protein